MLLLGELAVAGAMWYGLPAQFDRILDWYTRGLGCPTLEARIDRAIGYLRVEFSLYLHLGWMESEPFSRLRSHYPSRANVECASI